MAIVIFGPPGSGKGTQAKLLMRGLGVPHVSTGDILRDRIRSGADLGTRAMAAMRNGGLVCDDVMNRLVAQRLTEPDAANGFILDGYPRTLTQAEHFAGWLAGKAIREVVIHLEVDYNIIIARLTGRRQCPRCGTVYNVASNPPKVAGLCDLDGESLITRDDDREDVIRERFEAYERQTWPVLEFFRKSGHRVVKVQTGDEAPEAVNGKIRQVMESA